MRENNNKYQTNGQEGHLQTIYRVQLYEGCSNNKDMDFTCKTLMCVNINVNFINLMESGILVYCLTDGHY